MHYDMISRWGSNAPYLISSTQKSAALGRRLRTVKGMFDLDRNVLRKSEKGRFLIAVAK